eukprot:6013961-Prymnesium_polylepis.2
MRTEHHTTLQGTAHHRERCALAATNGLMPSLNFDSVWLAHTVDISQPAPEGLELLGCAVLLVG